jgi:hypothetical protein
LITNLSTTKEKPLASTYLPGSHYNIAVIPVPWLRDFSCVSLDACVLKRNSQARRCLLTVYCSGINRIKTTQMASSEIGTPVAAFQRVPQWCPIYFSSVMKKED